MAKSHPRAGGFNLKGKRSLRLSCRCCVAIDFRGDIKRRIACEEIKLAKRHHLDTDE